MNAITDAFQRAGYGAPEMRLITIAKSILRVSKQSWSAPDPTLEINPYNRELIAVARAALKATDTWDGAKEELYARVRKDPDLLWALLAPFKSQAAQQVLTQASRELRQLEVAAMPQPSAGAKRGLDTSIRMPPRAAHQPKPSAPIPTINQQRAAMNHRANIAKLSMLDTFKVNGQPIGDLTSAEAVKWAGARERDARFVRMLTANLPPDEPIRKFRTGEDAAAIYAQAEMQNA